MCFITPLWSENIIYLISVLKIIYSNRLDEKHMLYPGWCTVCSWEAECSSLVTGRWSGYAFGTLGARIVRFFRFHSSSTFLLSFWNIQLILLMLVSLCISIELSVVDLEVSCKLPTFTLLSFDCQFYHDIPFSQFFFLTVYFAMATLLAFMLHLWNTCPL